MPALFEIDKIKDLLIKHDIYTGESGKLPESIEGLHTDSRKIKRNYTFLCIKGLLTDGHKYYTQALDNGASLFICEDTLPDNLPQIQVTDSRKAAEIIAKAFYGIDDSKMKIAGITGTNGKTTTAYLAWQLSKSLGIKSAYIGTIGCYFGEEKLETSLTTPDTIELMELLHLLQNKGMQVVFMEVSSHALIMQRLDSLRFSCAAFLNLTQDHLDFHNNMHEYAEAKFKLFKLLKKNGTAIINVASEYGEKLFNQTTQNKLSFGKENSDISIRKENTEDVKSCFRLKIKDEEGTIISPLAGGFNIENLSMAIAIISSLSNKLSLTMISKKVENLKPAPGRLERVANVLDLPVYIDYAHTPDAISKACAAISQFTRGRLITIIGAGGNRDKAKRPIMLQAALENSDIVVVTTDNPRYENPEEIIKDIFYQSSANLPVWIKINREDAIFDAINVAKKGDSILITGKGHEQYQEICGEIFPFNERNIITQAAIEINNIHPDLDFDSLMLEYAATGLLKNTSNKKINRISTDSRILRNNSLFIPIKGERFDGHDYIERILTESSCITLSEDIKYDDNERVIYVDSTLKALGRIARSYRRFLGTELIAITGSTGKTTVKEYLSFMLSKMSKTARTSANENNFIGVPKTLLNLKPDDEYGVIELGTNHFGEIDWLTWITLPQVSAIINIGASHLEYFINLEGVFKEKINIFNYGVSKCFYPGDDKHFSSTKGISFGFSSNNDFHFSELAKDNNHYAMKINGKKFKFKVDADFQVINAGIAASIAMYIGMMPDIIQECLLHLPNIDKRLQIIQKGKAVIISDCYNANPESMKTAIKYWLEQHPEKAHIAFLGSMLELGNNSERYHATIGNIVTSNEPNMFITIGKVATHFGSQRHFPNVDALLKEIYNLRIPDDSIILVKGSHGVHLEKLVDRLVEIFNEKD